MNKQLVKEGLGFGLLLWVFGYVLGVILFMVVPPSMIGWIITPLGTVLILWILWKKIRAESMNYYLMLAIIWTVMAIGLDYLFIVKLLKPVDGYYKFDVYLYYTLTFVLPLVVGGVKKGR